MGSEREIKIKIADIAISLDRDGTDLDLRLGQVYQPFFGDSQPDLSVHVKDNIPDLPLKEVIFDSSPVWTLYRDVDRSIIRVFPEERIPFLERMLVFDSELRSVYLHVRPNPMCSPLSFDPLMYPVGELLMVNYLARGRGAIVHGCGVARQERGLLFVGESGAGKSTLARLWDQEGTEVLSDDRIIVRKREDTFWMYGTPWHGDASFVSPRGVTLERMCFLRHEQENSLREIKAVDAVSRLITCSFLPHWDPQGMAFSMDLFTDLVAHVPCYELTFKPDKTAIELVKEIAGY